MPGQPRSPRKPRVPHVLLVNGARRDYAEALTAAGFRVTTVENVKAALGVRARPDAVIVELVVPDGSLGDLARTMKSGRRTRAMAVIALAPAGHEQAVTEAGATFCLHPCPPEELVALVRRTLARDR